MISYTEFCDRKTLSEKAFEALDINADGYISKQEMMVASTRTTGRRLSKPEVDATFKEFDQNKDNKLSYKEFCVMMNKKRNSDAKRERRGSLEAGKSEACTSNDWTPSNGKKYQVK